MCIIERMIIMAKVGGNIVVVGGGAAGMTAAISARQLGAEGVILLNAAERLGGNSVYILWIANGQ